MGDLKVGDLYVDLLERTLTGAISEEPGYAPAVNPLFASYNERARASGEDWPMRAMTMVGLARLRQLGRAVQTVIAEDVPGDFIETGVWRGGASIYMRALLSVFGDSHRCVWVADSFRGLPPADAATYPADSSINHLSTIDYLRVSLEQVKANFAKFNMLDDRVRFLEGWFRDTLPKAPIDRLAILRLDGDMYESTMTALEPLYPKVSPGGFVIVDDYHIPACRQAVTDFRSRNGIDDPIEPIDQYGVFWRVSSNEVRTKKPADGVAA